MFTDVLYGHTKPYVRPAEELSVKLRKKPTHNVLDPRFNLGLQAEPLKLNRN
jgi:hypothetical protein